MRTLAFRPPDLTSTGITARSVLLALTLSLGATGCVTEPVSAKCDPSNCTGCCLGEVCEAGTTVFACGTAGQACALCSNNQVCSGTCTTLTGGGGGGGGSSCDGGTNAALCAEARASCGPLQVIDVCGQQRSITSCGTCAANQACTNGTCACVPETDQQFCARQGRACGAASGLDNCGVSRSVSSCGSCVSGNACTAGVCACAGETNAQF